MLKAFRLAVAVAALALPATSFGALINTITGFTPAGAMTGPVTAGNPQFQITSITTTGAITASTPSLQGPVAAEVTAGAGINSGVATGHGAQASPTVALLGLDAGDSALGLGAANPPVGGRAVAAWFAQPVIPDGTAKPEIFVIDWALGRDNYQVQLLTSNAVAGIAGAVTAATVQVLIADQASTTTTVAFSGTQPLAGVGINLDDASLTSGTQILGVLIPSADGLGGLTGLDLAVIAAVVVPEPSTLMLLVLGTMGVVISRRRM